MKLFSIAFAVFIVMGSAQTPPAAPPKLAPDTVIATVDGKKVTFSEAEKYLKGLPPQMQRLA
jgi:hypothetical protein